MSFESFYFNKYWTW